MKKTFEILILLIIIGVAAYHFRSQLFPPPLCSEPIPYNLGTFNTQFGISKADFLADIATADNIWEKSNLQPTGKQFFEYEPNDTDPNVLKINLIYDYRQEATATLNSLGITVKNDQATYDSLKAKYDALKIQINNTQDPVQKNAEIDELNALVVTLNNIANTLNLSVNQYNTTNDTRGESFEEGEYVSDGTTRYIDIYEYSNYVQLVRVLAHELGHALGLQHVLDPNAIMYKLNQGTTLALAPDDIAELKSVCNIK